MLLIVPLVLLGGAAGGFFLANRTWRPIDRMTRMAREISARELSQRIHYNGVPDEVGRLAQTFDQMLDRLQAAFEREKRFTSDPSHELRTPLTAIKGRIGVILNQSRTPAEYEIALQQIEKQVDRLIRLTNDLLFLSRFDRHHLPWQPVRLELSSLLEATLEQMEPLAVDRLVRLTANIKPGLLIEGDPDHLIRVFLNLLDNAIKYTPAYGKVTLQANHQSSQVYIVVQDTGQGISAEHLPYLFGRFYQVEAARSSGGVGLGLAIAHEVIRLHGGSLTVQSQLNQGTVHYSTASIHCFNPAIWRYAKILGRNGGTLS